MYIQDRNIIFIIILIIYYIISPNILAAQELLMYIADNDTVAYSDRNESELTIKANEIIKSNSTVTYGVTRERLNEYHLVILFGELNDRYWTFAKEFRAGNADNVFGNDIFINYPMDLWDSNARQAGGNQIKIGDVNDMWVPSYYCDILIEQNRNALVRILPSINLFTERGFVWYENTQADIQHGRTMFYNSVIKLGAGTHLAVKNIKKTDNGYIVDSVVSILDMRVSGDKLFPESTFWDKYKPGDSLTLLINIDGDYLDIYIDDSNIHVGTFNKVGKEFIKQYQSLIKTNSCNLSNVQWPKRVDGSRHFMIPDNITSISATHRTTDNLRLRETTSTSAKIVTTLPKDTEVQVIETGSDATINDITAPWVKVISSTGYTGWCFSGYLEEIADNNFAVVNIAEEEISAQETNDKSAMPLPLLLAIIGGATVAGSVVFMVLIKKK